MARSRSPRRPEASPPQNHPPPPVAGGEDPAPAEPSAATVSVATAPGLAAPDWQGALSLLTELEGLLQQGPPAAQRRLEAALRERQWRDKLADLGDAVAEAAQADRALSLPPAILALIREADQLRLAARAAMEGPLAGALPQVEPGEEEVTQVMVGGISGP